MKGFLPSGRGMVGFRLWGYWGSAQIYDSTYLDEVHIDAEPCPVGVGVEEKGETLLSLRLKQNPGVGGLRLAVSSPGEFTLRVYDPRGALVASGNGAGLRDFIYTLRPGVYLARLNSGGNVRVIKAVVR